MGERGATEGAWGARDDASWWPGSANELQNQQQLNEDVARSTASVTHQLFTYKMTGGFANNSSETNTTNFDYRLMSDSNNRQESPQQHWWYAAGNVEPHQQTSSPTPQNQSSSDSEQGNAIQNLQQQSQQEQNQLQQQQELQQALQQQNLQQALQQQQNHQALQQMLQQHQQNQQQNQQNEAIQNLQQTLQVSQAQAQAIVRAQAVLQHQVEQTLHQQQQNLQEHLQAVQQHQLQAALQQQTVTLQVNKELQQQAQQHALIVQAANKGRMPKARAFNKPRGRMTAYAFFVQTCREEHKKKHPDENVVFAAFSKKCAERWNTMLEKEKQRFHEMAEQDKKRYDIEMQNYVPPKDVRVGRGRKRNIVKDPKAPKRSLSAFFWFCNDERSKVKAENPEYTMGDTAKELGRRWAAASPETKSKYESLSEQDKARYDKEMTEYKRGPLALVQQQQQQLHEMEDDVNEYHGDEEYK